MLHGLLVRERPRPMIKPVGILVERSRSVFAPIACAFSAAARPSSNTFGDRRPPNGLPQALIATPHWAMPHDGSADSTWLNPAAASVNSNEWSSAIA